MYTPANKGLRGIVQDGGAYISNMANPSTLLISSISKETLSTISWMANMSSIANISSYDEISNLSISQISTLIAAVTQQISNENTNIINNQSEIAQIQSQIDAIPDGYQAQYDAANQEYINTQRAYELAQAVLVADQLALRQKMDELEYLSSLSSMYTSSLEGYAREYSSIWDSIQVNNDIMAKEDAEYQSRLRAYLQYIDNYNVASYNLESTLHALNLNSSILSTATYDYYTTSTAYGLLLDDYINFSTNNLSISQYLFTTANKHLSGLLDLQSTQLGQYLSTSTALHLANMNVASAQATLDYRNALSKELSSIVDYNRIQEQLRNLLNNRRRVQTGGNTTTNNSISDSDTSFDYNDIPFDLDYFRTQTAPAGQELEYNTLYIMLSTLSTTMYTTSKQRELSEVNQSDVQLVTLKAVLDVADYNISQAEHTYYLAQLNQSSVISTMSGLSTRIGIADIMEDNYLSTLSSLSTIYYNDLSTYNGIQDSISTYIYTQNLLSSFLRSTLLTLLMLSEQSTINAMSIAIYTQSYIGYSTLEGIAQSSIDGYSSIKGYTLSTMAGLDGEIGGLNGLVGSQFTELTANAETYYNNVITDLNNELDAYKYGIQEWNSFIGYIASELLIQKLNLYTAIDSITFRLQTNITSEQQALLVSQRNSYGTLQTNIQSIIDTLNVLDVRFANILTEIEDERTDKTSFVNTRSILTAHEINVFKNPSQYSVVQEQYIYQMANLNTRVNSINSHILQRNQMITALYEIINPQLTIIEGLNILSYTLPDPIQTTVPPFNLDKTEYQLLPQLNYGLNPTMYPLILTNIVPNTITDVSILPNGLFYIENNPTLQTTTLTSPST